MHTAATSTLRLARVVEVAIVGPLSPMVGRAIWHKPLTTSCFLAAHVVLRFPLPLDMPPHGCHLHASSAWVRQPPALIPSPRLTRAHWCHPTPFCLQDAYGPLEVFHQSVQVEFLKHEVQTLLEVLPEGTGPDNTVKSITRSYRSLVGMPLIRPEVGRTLKKDCPVLDVKGVVGWGVCIMAFPDLKTGADAPYLGIQIELQSVADGQNVVLRMPVHRYYGVEEGTGGKSRKAHMVSDR